MKHNDSNIMLGHGSGGTMMHELIEKVFLSKFGDKGITEQGDSAVLPDPNSEIAFTTDSFVIDPVFFPGGDIGKLAVCGTVNDLAVSGAKPLYISVSFIIEEGFPMNDLDRIAESIAKEAAIAGVRIVTGDTKVVNRGKCDKIFINTSGIGIVERKNSSLSAGNGIAPGDIIIINGYIGDHGMAVLNARESFNFRLNIDSDCAPLNHLTTQLTDKFKIKFMRDPTRGGVASLLNELAAKCQLGITIDESSLPVRGSVKAMCELLGFDPLHVANEGKVVLVADRADAKAIIETMKLDKNGSQSAVIGMMVDEHPGKVVMRNQTGGSRIVDMLSGDQLPRIC